MATTFTDHYSDLLGSLPKKFCVSKSNAIGVPAAAMPGIILFSYVGVHLLLRSGAGTASLVAGVMLLLAAAGVVAFVSAVLATRIELRKFVIDYEGLVGRKTIPVCEIVSMEFGSIRGTFFLHIKTLKEKITISSATFSDADLRFMEEFVYVAAELTSNSSVKRPLRQLSIKDVPQKEWPDFKQK